jgi:hypothetical protein
MVIAWGFKKSFPKDRKVIIKKSSTCQERKINNDSSTPKK